MVQYIHWTVLFSVHLGILTLWTQGHKTETSKKNRFIQRPSVHSFTQTLTQHLQNLKHRSIHRGFHKHIFWAWGVKKKQIYALDLLLWFSLPPLSMSKKIIKVHTHTNTYIYSNSQNISLFHFTGKKRSVVYISVYWWNVWTLGVRFS